MTTIDDGLLRVIAKLSTSELYSSKPHPPIDFWWIKLINQTFYMATLVDEHHASVNLFRVFYEDGKITLTGNGFERFVDLSDGEGFVEAMKEVEVLVRGIVNGNANSTPHRIAINQIKIIQVTASILSLRCLGGNFDMSQLSSTSHEVLAVYDYAD
jgi:hypothetical protein